MINAKLKHLYLAILICVFVMNAIVISLVHAAPTIPGVQRLEEGIAAYEHGEYDDAIFKLEMAVYQIDAEDKDQLWDAHFYLGLSYHLTGDDGDARKQFIKAQGLIKNRLPDSDIHSPKIVKLFNETLKPKQVGVWKDLITDMEFVFVKGGCYEMGDTFDDGYENEKLVHEVCLDDFYIGKYEVTQGQWKEIMGGNPSYNKNGSNYPVENVSWNDVQGFIRKLNKKTGKNYRLPTEAEWEYAARSGGKREKYAGFSNENELYKYANFVSSNSVIGWKNDNQNDEYDNTSPVGNYKPNGLGIYDMAGNVSEMCQDWYGKGYYYKSLRNNPKGPKSGSHRVIRGGAFTTNPWYCRSSTREKYGPLNFSICFLGFRLVLPQAIR